MNRRGAACKHSGFAGILRPGGFISPGRASTGVPAGRSPVGRGDVGGFINAYLTQLATGELNKK